MEEIDGLDRVEAIIFAVADGGHLPAQPLVEHAVTQLVHLVDFSGETSAVFRQNGKDHGRPPFQETDIRDGPA
jgi:hypothetical protein